MWIYLKKKRKIGESLLQTIWFYARRCSLLHLPVFVSCKVLCFNHTFLLGFKVFLSKYVRPKNKTKNSIWDTLNLLVCLDTMYECYVPLPPLILFGNVWNFLFNFFVPFLTRANVPFLSPSVIFFCSAAPKLGPRKTLSRPFLFIKSEHSFDMTYIFSPPDNNNNKSVNTLFWVCSEISLACFLLSC